MTKYQLEHTKQPKNSQAKQAPQHICIAIKKPKLKPTPYIRNKQPEVKRPFLSSPLIKNYYQQYLHFQTSPFPSPLSRPPPVSPPVFLLPLSPS